MKRITLCLLIFISICGGVKAQFYTAKVNGLGLATGTVNAAVELSISKQWSVELAGYWNPVQTKSFRTTALWIQPAVRYWIFEHFVGHFISTHITVGKYDIGNAKHHFKGWLSGIGCSYGYTWILSKRWNMTAEAGLGLYYLRDKLRSYEIPEWQPIRIVNYQRVVLAPSKLEISFSYLF